MSKTLEEATKELTDFNTKCIRGSLEFIQHELAKENPDFRHIAWLAKGLGETASETAGYSRKGEDK